MSGSPLAQAAAAFAWLTCEPGPLTIDARAIRGLGRDMSRGPIRLDVLRDRLTHPSCRPATRDAAWAHLIRRARAHGDAWTIACVGLALPDLTTLARRLTRSLPTTRPRHGARPEPQSGYRDGSPAVSRGGSRGADAFGRRGVARRDADIESAILTGFLTALAELDLSRPRIAIRLRAAAEDAGRLACREITLAPTPRASLFTSTPPPAPARHPDLVLARAVAAAALTPYEAALIGATRLEPISLARIAPPAAPPPPPSPPPATAPNANSPPGSTTTPHRPAPLHRPMGPPRYPPPGPCPSPRTARTPSRA